MKLERSIVALVGLLAFSVSAVKAAAGDEAPLPNILVILCDDLGYGDVQCLNPDHGKIKTPSIDRLASQGMTFTDAHSGSSVCTPTRYGLMTGRYSWRTPLQRGVVQGFAPCVIADSRPTIASFLKSHGYRTGLVGKWHLNMRFYDQKETELKGKPHKFTAPVGSSVREGPNDHGFDFFFGIHHARSMKAIIKQNKVVEHDDVIHFLPRCEKESVDFIKTSAKQERPFFLYVPLGSPHTPIVPTADWEGKSGLNKYADFVMQTDHVVGNILRALKETNVAENTLVIFSSDNGCSKAANINQLTQLGHRVSAWMRGSKADIWEGGHRVPFIVRWPGEVAKGSQCDQLICMTDVFATVADVIEQPKPKMSCEDSVSFAPALRGNAIKSQRHGVVHHSFSGHFAYRSQNWKLILARGSAGWTSPKEKQVPEDAPDGQLYDLRSDPGEQNNLFETKSEVVERLLSQLTEDVQSGRSTAGIESPNDFSPIKLWKSGRKQKE